MGGVNNVVAVVMLVCIVSASTWWKGGACGHGCGGGSGSGSSSGSSGGNGGSSNNGGSIPATRPTPTKTCSVDVVKVGVCSPLLGGVPANGCCPLLGLLGLDIEVCLCLAVDVNVLGLVNVHLPKLDIVATILTTCGYNVPPNFTCPP